MYQGHLNGDEACTLAFEMYTYRLRKYIGAYTAVLDGKVDAVVFTAGVGQNHPAMREAVLRNMSPMGYSIDSSLNKKSGTINISLPSSRSRILVIPTNEENQIAVETLETISRGI